MNLLFGNPRLRPASLCCAAAILLGAPAAAQVTVTTGADQNDSPAGAEISLREALRDLPTGGTITFAPALAGKALALLHGEITVAGKSVSVNAPGGFTIEARGASRIFRISSGAELRLTGITLQGGSAPDHGGAVFNDGGVLRLTDCVLRENHAADGTTGTKGAPGYPFGGTGGPGGPGANGGAVMSTGSLIAERTFFLFNSAGSGGTGGAGGNVQIVNGFETGGRGGAGGSGGSGGAIFSSGTVHLTACLFDSNSSGGGGRGGEIGFPLDRISSAGNGGPAGNGGAIHQSGSLTADRCSFLSNQCPPGGAQPVNQADPFIISLNHGSAGSGAAAWYTAGPSVFTNCTFTGNTTAEGGGEAAGGTAGGSGGTLRLVHCTLSENRSIKVITPGVYNFWLATKTAGISSSTAQCENCILSGNFVNRNGTSYAPVWEESNFVDGATPVFIPFGPMNGTPGWGAQLGPPVIAGGSLPVLMPGPSSPARNTGAMLSAPLSTDERSLPRPVGIPDLGAVEVQASEGALLTPQHISFTAPPTLQGTSLTLSATASSGLPVTSEIVSGQATVSGNNLTIQGAGLIVVRATQPGNATTAPALPVVRVIEAGHFIPFTPLSSYTVFPPGPVLVSLPATTSASLPITWSIVGSPGAAFALNGTQLTATGAGSVTIRGTHPGNATYAAVDQTWTLTFVQGTVRWDTPPGPGGGPRWFTLVEGSPYGLSLTARLSSPHTSPVPVPVPAGFTATPASIPAGQDSATCLLKLSASPALTNQSLTVSTGPAAAPLDISLFLANRNDVPLDVFAPVRALAGAPATVDISIPGVPVPGLYGPPPDLAVRNVTVTASDFDNPAISIPVTLNEVTTDPGFYPRKHLRVTFPATNRRARLTVLTDDGISGHSAAIQLYADTDTNSDGDGINDIVEAALQRQPGQPHSPPLVIQPGPNGLRIILDSRPLNLQGWSLSIELSTDLQTWLPAPAASTTATLNPGGTTETVTVTLPPGHPTHYARLRASLP